MCNARPLRLITLASLLLVACGRDGLLPEPSDFRTRGDLARPAGDGAIPPDLGPPVDGEVPDGPTDGPLMLVSIALTPPAATLAVKTQAALLVTGTYSDNSTADLTQMAAWTSSSDAVATVAGGLVSALSPGTATITARVGGLAASAQITVTAATIKAIEIAPANGDTAIGGRVLFTAVATLSDGSKQDVTQTALWAVADGVVATISNQGVATGIAPGTTAITATAGGVVGKALLTVRKATLKSLAITPLNPTVGVNVNLQFTATGTFSDGSVADLTATSLWAASAPMVLDIDQAGLASSFSPGTSVVTATVGNLVATTTVTVTAARLVSITIAPATATLAIGGTQPLRASGTYSDGSVVDLTTSATWSSSAPGVASVANAQGSQGLVSALAPGPATVTASLGNVAGSATITVLPAKLVAITVTPLAAVVARATTVQFVARGTYSDGSIVDLTAQATWSSDEPRVATVSNAQGQSGLASALAVGSTTIRATLGGIAGKATITVTDARLVAIDVTPANPTLAVGQKQLMKATGRFSDNTTSDLTALAVWTTDPNVAAVSNAVGSRGQVTAVAPGMTAVTATFQGISGSTLLTVSLPRLSQIVVTPISPSRPIGQPMQFTATAIFSNNTQLNVTAQSAWSSSSPAIAAINMTGGVLTMAAGKTTITATYMGLAGSSTLTVTAAVVVSIQVTPINPTYVAGTVQQLQASAIFSDNTSQNVTGFATWTSSSPQVAQVSTAQGSRGRLTAIAAGTTTVSATFQGVTGSTIVKVSPAVVVAIDVFPAVLDLAPGQTRQLTASAIFSDNTSMQVTGAATWISSDPSVAAVNTGPGPFGRGTVRALAPGKVTITATYMGVTGSATVTVTQATLVAIQIAPAAPVVAKGVPVLFRASAIYSDNTSQDVTGQATWQSSDVNVAQVSNSFNSKGVTQSLGAGKTTISATYMGITGTTVLTVTAATLKMIQVTPFAPTLPIGFVTQLLATGIYDDNTTQDLTQLATWTSSAANVAAVSNTFNTKGRLQPIAAGKTVITASYLGVNGTDAVVVTAATLTAITIAPPRFALAVGAQQQLVATGTFSDGSKLDVTVYVTWLSSAPAVADVSNAFGSQGLAKALGKGMAVISAVRGNATGMATVLVQ